MTLRVVVAELVIETKASLWYAESKSTVEGVLANVVCVTRGSETEIDDWDDWWDGALVQEANSRLALIAAIAEGECVTLTQLRNTST